MRRARHGHGVPADERHLGQPPGEVVLAASPPGRLAAAVERDQAVAPGVVQDREQVAAEPAGARQRQPLDAGHGQRGVERVAAAL